MEAASTRVRLRVAPGATRADVVASPRRAVTLVSRHSVRDKIVQLAGVEPDDIERRLSSAAGKERRP